MHFQRIFFQEFMATQDSVQWVKEDVIAAVLHVSPKWTMFDKPVRKVDFKIYVSQCSLWLSHKFLVYNVFSANMSDNLLQCILAYHDIHIVAMIKNTTAVKVLSKSTEKINTSGGRITKSNIQKNNGQIFTSQWSFCEIDFELCMLIFYIFPCLYHVHKLWQFFWYISNFLLINSMVSYIQEVPKVLVKVSEDMLYSPVCDIEEAVHKDANVPLSIQGVIQKVISWYIYTLCIFHKIHKSLDAKEWHWVIFLSFFFFLVIFSKGWYQHRKRCQEVYITYCRNEDLSACVWVTLWRKKLTLQLIYICNLTDMLLVFCHCEDYYFFIKYHT